MKRIITILLAATMLLSLSACNSKKDEENNDTKTEATDTLKPNDTENSEETTKDTETESVTETEAPSSAFDTSWASNDFEKLIPQPPFEGWNGAAGSDSVYEMVTSQANADEKLNADGTFAYYDTWAAYIQSLTDYGFTVDGDVYKATATDANGNTIKLMCGDGHAWITIIVK